MNEFKIRLGEIDGVKIWENRVFEDSRGKLVKSYVENSENFGRLQFQTVEHFFTVSKLNVFRGMHLQSGVHPSSKIVSLVVGSATDFLLDLRTGSKTFGHLQIEELGLEQPKSVFIPSGIAHGYTSNSEGTVFSYRYNSVFCSDCDSGISPKLIERFIGVPISDLIVSERDKELSPSFEFANHNRNHL
jgi:dTDP-4-dehydrorhamnose 3,5-epimerase